MKAKIILIISLILTVALICCGAVFFSHHPDNVENLFNDAIKALDNEQGLEELFLPSVKEESKTILRDIRKINKFYVGKSVEINDYNFYRESATGYRMYAVVKTDADEYFVCMSGTGARMVDSLGLNQLIIERNEEFQHKKIFKKKEFDKYLDHAEEFGVTIRVKGDK